MVFGSDWLVVNRRRLRTLDRTFDGAMADLTDRPLQEDLGRQWRALWPVRSQKDRVYGTIDDRDGRPTRRGSPLAFDELGSTGSALFFVIGLQQPLLILSNLTGILQNVTFLLGIVSA